MKRYLKIVKDTERRIFITDETKQLVYLNWKQIMQIIDLLIYKETNSEIILDPDEGD